MQVRLAARPGHGLRLQHQHPKVVGQATTAFHRVQALGQLRVLGSDPGRIAAVLPVVIETGGRTNLVQLFIQARVVVAQRNQRRRANGHRVRAQRHGLGHVGPVANPP
ncbi:hypothetical protein D3C75_1168910 [compost metagenome]